MSINHPLAKQRRESPSVIKQYPDIHIGKLRFIVRLLKYSTTPLLLDIREWLLFPAGSIREVDCLDVPTGRMKKVQVTQDREYSGFGKRGLALSIDSLNELEALIPLVKKDIESYGEKQGIDASASKESRTDSSS